MSRSASHLLGIVLALLPPLSIYKVIPGFTLATILTFVAFGIYFFYRTKLATHEKKPELTLYIVVFIMGFISLIWNMSSTWYSIDLYSHNLFALTVDFLAIFWITYSCNKESFFYASTIIAVAASVLCIHQWFSILFLGSFVLNTYLPGFEIIRDIETITVTRPCAFFTEPAHVCMFIGPVLYFNLLRKHFFVCAILMMGMLFSTSTTGFLFILVIPAVYLYKTNFKIWYIILGLIIVMTAYLIINTYYPEILEFATNKISNTDASDDQRLFGPLKYFQYLGVDDMLFGIGLNQLENFIINARGSLLLEGSGNYSMSLLYMFFSYGLFGFISLVLYLKHYWYKAKLGLGYVVVILAIMSSDQILFSSFFVYLVSFMILGIKYENDKTNNTTICTTK